MIRLTLFYLTFILTYTLTAQNDAQLLRHPAISPDGRTVAFSYQGDIFTVPAEGGTARRLTVQESYESYPSFSPDGKQIAFVGNRYGNNDIFTMSAEGSLPVRVTYHSTSDNSPSWHSNKDLTFTTRRAYAELERIPEIHKVAASGGTPVRMMDGLGSMPVTSPDGRYVAFVRGSCRIEREAYRGPANRDLWLYDTQTKAYTRLTTDEGQDIYPQWADDNTLYYLSAREDSKYNLYRQRLRNGKPDGKAERRTNYDRDGIRYYRIGGGKVVMERGMELSIADLDRLRFKTLRVELARDFKFYPTEELTITRGLREYEVSPSGKYVLFGSRGELFVKLNDKDKSRAKNLSDHPYRDRNAQWLNDSVALFLSDRDGQYELYRIESSDREEGDIYRTFERKMTRLTNTKEDEQSFLLSPDHSKLALRVGRGDLVLYDIDSLGRISNKNTLLDGWATPSGLAWSPDSKWLAYSLSDLDFNADVYIHAADGSREPVNVSLHPRGDYSPVWSPDGSKLGFTSSRNNGDYDVWFVWLREEDYERTRRDWEEEDEYEADDAKKKKKKAEPEPVMIDFEDIHERLVQVTGMPGNEGNLLIGPEGEYFYFTTNGRGRATGNAEPSLMRVKWDGSDMETLMSKANVGALSLGPDMKKMYLLNRGGLASTPIGKGKLEAQAVSGRMTLDHAREREEMFEDGWRALRDGFYDPQFHGRDWEALRKKYKPIAMAASTKQDFQEIYNEMLGQLDASHMGLRGVQGDEDVQRDRTGQLGIEVEPVRNGVRVTRVLAEAPAGRKRSQLQVGDVITAVNGEPVSPGQSFYALLNGTAEERTQLTIRRGGAEQDLVIRPSRSIRAALYENWVDERRAMVERLSGGKLGYIHIQGMNWPSFERFERELTASGYGKEGLVIDVRFNGGGWTTDMLMTVLNVRQHAYTVPRGATDNLERNNKKYRANYPFGERLPLSAWTKPSIALCNENSYSNAEIFSHAYKQLDLGQLVGQPTFGAVISTGGHGLLDGSFVRMPFRAWYAYQTQENMEGGPAVPDVIVSNPPDAKAKGSDPQLERAVQLLMEDL